jgi:NAD(P)-dependent dehydrogenase (short-subunit alcohol dehydrogenase family)
VALTRALVGAGYKVHAAARNLVMLETVYAAEIAAGQVEPAMLDVTDAESVHRFFESRFPPGTTLDLLFNNAGRFASVAPLWDADEENWWGDVVVNVRGTFLVTRRALAVMRRQDRGIIVSMEGGRPPAGSGYGVGKAGVRQMTRTLAEELRKVASPILVYVADPGLVETDMSRAIGDSPFAAEWLPEIPSRIADGSTHRPEEIAAKLIQQLPHMSPANSGSFFDKATPAGTFLPLT